MSPELTSTTSDATSAFPICSTADTSAPYGGQDVPAAKARKQAKWDRAMRREGNRSFANPNRKGHKL